MINKKSLSVCSLRTILIILASFTVSILSAQNVKLSGTVKDASTGESLIGANIIYAPGKGMVADLDGNFMFELPKGTYEIHISFIGYQEVIKNVELIDKSIHLNVGMELLEMDEVKIISDFARERSTPVAFSSVSQKQIAQELGATDGLATLLNYTPGVYATNQGGGDGDSRINIRGFDQRNIAVMIDGIPVNDMENGWVYWSNWALPVKQMQVQRGLSASKLALPSIGGTLNVITAGIDSKPQLKFRQVFASGNFTQSSVSFNSGKLKGDWGVVATLLYKTGDGVVDGTYTKGLSYFLKVEKFIGNHRISFTGLGVPQEHGQRSFKSEISLYDRELARKSGVPDSVINGIPEMGVKYNEHWGTYENYEVVGNGVANNPLNPNVLTYVDSTVTQNGSIIRKSERSNYYHKPSFTLRDFWSINANLFWINSAYASFGRGGGTGLNSRSTVGYDANQQIRLQDVYFANRINTESQGFDDTFRTIDTTYSFTEYKGTNYLRSSVNNHDWYGFLSQITWKINHEMTFSGGIDLRAYKGIHYREIYDLMGADYILDSSNENEFGTSVKKVGDKVYYYDEGLVRWAGFFTQLEYTTGAWSTFLNVTGSTTSYNGIDYFRLSPENNQHYETGWQNFYGFTVKLGANYNLNENMNVFANIGHLNNAPKFNSVIDISNNVIEDVENEKVYSAELGYSLNYRDFGLNLNGFYTTWDNRPINRSISVPHPDLPGENASVFLRTMDAIHMGIEFDAKWKFHRKWDLIGLFSIQDNTWQSKEVVDYQFNGQPILDDEGNPIQLEVDPRGVHVGDAAQLQFGGGLEFKPSNSSYIKLRYTRFGKNYSDFNPESVVGENAGRESWKIPDYQLLDLFAGYSFNLDFGLLDLSFIVNNLLDEVYISDALNNETRSRFVQTQNFDAASAGVFPGLPRRFTFSIKLTLF